jgi:hypothetical protein
MHMYLAADRWFLCECKWHVSCVLQAQKRLVPMQVATPPTLISYIEKHQILAILNCMRWWLRRLALQLALTDDYGAYGNAIFHKVCAATTLIGTNKLIVH